MRIREIENLEDVKHNLKIMWGAIWTFQTQLYSIAGDISEIQSTISDVMAGINDLASLAGEIKKFQKGEINNVPEMIEEYKQFKKEVENIETKS